MAGFELGQDETQVGTWTIHYLPQTGGKWAGKLVVTDRRIVFDPLDSKVDYSAAGIAGILAAGTVVERVLKNYWDGETLSIPRSEIESVTKRGRLLMKQVVVQLVDGQQHVFDYGLLSVDKLVALLQS